MPDVADLPKVRCAEGEPDPDVPLSQVPASPPVFGTAFAIRKAADVYEPIAKATRRQMLKSKVREADEEDAEPGHVVVVPNESPSEHRRLSSVVRPVFLARWLLMSADGDIRAVGCRRDDYKRDAAGRDRARRA